MAPYNITLVQPVSLSTQTKLSVFPILNSFPVSSKRMLLIPCYFNQLNNKHSVFTLIFEKTQPKEKNTQALTVNYWMNYVDKVMNHSLKILTQLLLLNSPPKKSLVYAGSCYIRSYLRSLVTLRMQYISCKNWRKNQMEINSNTFEPYKKSWKI